MLLIFFYTIRRHKVNSESNIYKVNTVLILYTEIKVKDFYDTKSTLLWSRL